MRIVYLCNVKWHTIRGAERLLISLLEYGRAEGHEPTVIAPAESALHQACRERRIPSVVAEFSPLPWKLWHLRSVLRRIRPDVVQGWSIFPVAIVDWFHLYPLKGDVTSYAYVSIDPTSVLPVATAGLQRQMLSVRNAISRWEAPRLDGIFVPTKTSADLLRSAGIRGRTIHVPGFIDPDRLRTEAQTPFAVSARRPRIGTAAFLEPLKGVDDLIRAFATVIKSHPEAVLLIAGDGPERRNLERLTRELGVAADVHFLGFVDPIAPMLAALDVYVSASHTEARGSSILEAMALGVPCVCTHVGGVSETVKDGVTGLLVDPGEPDALAETVIRALDDRALADRIGQAGRDLAGQWTYSIGSTLATVFGEYVRTRPR